MKIDLSQIKDLEHDLKNLAFKGFGFANKNALNDGVFKAREIARNQIEKKMTLRNRWTVGSIRVQKTNSIFINDQEAIVGSVADYMATQEFGGVEHKKGKHGVVIPTPFSAGEGMRKGPRSGAVEGKNRLSRLRIAGKGQRIKSIADARKAMGKRRKASMLIELNGKKAMYRVDRSRKRFDIRMLYSMNKQSVNVPRTPWLKPSVDETMLHMPRIYKTHLESQLRRARVYRSR